MPRGLDRQVVVDPGGLLKSVLADRQHAMLTPQTLRSLMTRLAKGLAWATDAPDAFANAASGHGQEIFGESLTEITMQAEQPSKRPNPNQP